MHYVFGGGGESEEESFDGEDLNGKPVLWFTDAIHRSQPIS
jgi:hypothetical protein